MSGSSSLDDAEKTPWFPGNVCPVHIGVYEKQVDRVGKYHFWNGCFWGGWSSSPEMAELNMGMRSSDQDSSWRGLAAPSP